MDNTNFPSATQLKSQPTKSKNSKNIVIGVLAAAVISLGGYLAYDKNKNTQAIQKQEAQIATTTDEKSEIQRNFDASLARLDSMTGINGKLQGQLNEKRGLRREAKKAYELYLELSPNAPDRKEIQVKIEQL